MNVVSLCLNIGNRFHYLSNGPTIAVYIHVGAMGFRNRVDDATRAVFYFLFILYILLEHDDVDFGFSIKRRNISAS